MMMIIKNNNDEEKLSLKHGTLKSHKLVVNSQAWNLMQYLLLHEVSDQEEKDVVLKIIDAVNTNEIYLHWQGKYVSKAEAKEYVEKYRRTP